MNRLLSLLVVASLLVTWAGCGQETSGPATGAIDGSKYLLASEPDGAEGVIDVRKNAKDGGEVVLVGRIGGQDDPWVEGRAAFSVVDPSIKSCIDMGDNCPKPWDYCCTDQETLAASKALVKVVDEQGELVKAHARDLLKVKELQTVVVRGKAQRDSAGNLTVLASGIYVRP
jgi:hypothetical protein